MLAPNKNRSIFVRALGLVSTTINRAILVLLIRFLFGSITSSGVFLLHANNKRGSL